jgi:hypothetical protein
MDRVRLKPPFKPCSRVELQGARIDDRQGGLDVPFEMVDGYAQRLSRLLLVESKARRWALDASFAPWRRLNGRRSGV